MRMVRTHLFRGVCGRAIGLAGDLFRNRAGSMVVETAIVTPVMAMMALGTFEAGLMIARQHELQSAASEVEAIILAANQGAQTNTTELQTILMDSVGLGAEDVAITRSFRCGTNDVYVTNIETCDEDDLVSSYLDISIRDTYEPTWTSFGIGRPIDYEVDRTVQIS